MAKPIKQKNVGPSTDIPWASAIYVNNNSGVDIVANDIVYVSGRSGLHLQVTLADADTPLASIGNLYVANHDIASGTTRQNYGYVLPWKTVLAVNTSAALGDGSPVYLSGTAGGWTAIAPATGSKIRIGTVLEDHAVSGAVLLAPGSSNADSGGASLSIADPGTGAALPIANSGIISMTTGGSGETNGLALPTFIGQRLTLALNVDGGGNREVTASAACHETTSGVVMTFADAGDTVELVAVLLTGALRWRVIGNLGAALS